ncbi:hypothetical protein TSAR_016228 [Trichomalopsis sarcophagae]|uniref:Uncharacterized protein n=1 Tax=Trichomalopsis sarcophagae TaxID=543379 RepID=A0A232FIH8_9HYME|nr:hypothetical protein TSAR_016228 [Trichomalopsis sarcophagae]
MGIEYQAIVYRLQLTNRRSGAKLRAVKKRWSPASFDREVFLCSLEGAVVEGTPTKRARNLATAITAACDASMATKSNSCGRPPVYWWSKEIAELRRECLRARRLHQRARNRPRTRRTGQLGLKMGHQHISAVAATVGFSQRGPLDPPHHPGHQQVVEQETRHRHVPSHPGANRTRMLSQLAVSSAECPICPGVDEDVVFHCPRFLEERQQFQEYWSGPLTPEGLGACLLESQSGWDAVVTLATNIIERLNLIRREEERRGNVGNNTSQT